MDIIFNKRVEKLNETFKKEVLTQLNCVKLGKSLSKMDIKYVDDNLRKKYYIKSFINAITEFNNDKENYKFTKIYMSNFEVFIEKFINKNNKKDEAIKVYCAVVLGEFKLSNYKINNFLIKSLNTKSIYLRVSSLEAISKIGNLNYFLEGIKYISDSNHYINNKIFIDVLNQFGGDQYLINKELMKNFDSFNTNFKKDIIEHFKNNKIEYVKNNLIEILKSQSYGKEVKISIIKYFSVVNYEQAQEEIIKILKEYDWEYRAICASALSSYKSAKSIKSLLEGITDKNWYVRYNSAMSLLEFDENIVEKALLKDDKYSRDVLFYAMFMKNKISFNEYIDKSKKLEVNYNV
ncbi:HEAT repeat domain-containing protein [Terrisporobacter vanillatitrophus]